VEAEKTKWEAEAAKGRRLPDGAPHIARYGDTRRYDNLETEDVAFAVNVLGAAKAQGRSRGGATDAALKTLAIRLVEDKNDNGRLNSAIGAMKMAGMPLKANELNQSTLASYGDEWVGVAYSGMLWERILSNAGIVGRIPAIEVPQGSESIVIPVEGAAPTFYKVAQASAQDANPGPITRTVTTSRQGTTNKTLAVGKLGAGTYYTGELEEDSFVPWAATLRRNLENEAADVLESLVIDGDTETGATTNINDIAGTPGGTEYFLVLNGFRKLALVTTTANSRSAGVLTVGDYLETVKLMGMGGRNALDRSKVSFIQDIHTNWTALQLPEILTRDVFSSPTIENGQLVNIFGYEVITSANMHRPNQDATYGLKAQTDGKIDLDTAADNTAGAILAVRWDQWLLGWKRRITFETVRVPSADATEITCLMRVGMTPRDGEASAISYGVTL
jgi:hypothetical protein